LATGSWQCGDTTSGTARSTPETRSALKARSKCAVGFIRASVSSATDWCARDHEFVAVARAAQAFENGLRRLSNSPPFFEAALLRRRPCLLIGRSRPRREPSNRPDTYQRLPTARSQLRRAAGPYIRGISCNSATTARNGRYAPISAGRGVGASRSHKAILDESRMSDSCGCPGSE
jgi:hypothetical protein